MAGPPKVALLIETSLGYGRGLLRGIVRYARLHGPWAFYITPGDLDQVLPKMEEWGGTGIIARIETARAQRAILDSGLPFVALDLTTQQQSPGSPLANACEICPDSHGAARLAADHLLEKGLRQFAFVGASGDPTWSARRREGFCQRITEAGCPCHLYPVSRPKEDRRWGHQQHRLADWLRTLPKPIGVMACDDDRGRQLLEACRAAGAQVPEDVAVVGVDNDELLCELSDPPLSSVKLDLERGGYDAAALLDGLMSGRVRPPQRIFVPPMYVMPRRSTDVVAMDDRMVADALRYIQDNAGQPIGVDDVARQSRASRRTLELRFRRLLGRSIHDELQRTRLERARRLLMETDLSIALIAEKSGFSAASYLTRVFRRQFGVPPAEYREQRIIKEESGPGR